MTPPGNASFSENDPQQQSTFWKSPPPKMQKGPPPPPPLTGHKRPAPKFHFVSVVK